MKNHNHIRLTCLILLSCFLLSLRGSSQDKEKRHGLSGDWKFILGDNKKFAKPEYNDSDWENIYVPSSWQEEGFRHYNGYAWYRITLKIDFKAKDALYLVLGKIDDVDEVYLNGHLIGTTGGFPPEYYTAVNYHRTYFLPEEYLNKNNKNVIAVRVYDEGGEGGIVGETSIGIYNYTQFSDNSLNLFGKWKFHLSDDENWSKENIDESGWEDIIVPSRWETQGYTNYDGFAWYRKNFELKSDFKKTDLVLLLGKIDDMDEVFINGTLIGSTGRINRKWTDGDEWSRNRTYPVPDGLLKTGTNVIAVRVYDQVGDGGIYEGPVTLLPRNEYREFWKKYNNVEWDFSRWFSNYID